MSDEIVTAPLVLDIDNIDNTVIATTDGRLYIIRGQSTGAATGRSFKVGSCRITASAGKLSEDSFVIGSDADRWVKAFRITTETVDNPNDPTQKINVPGRELLWEFYTDYGVPASISVDGNRIYFSDINGSFYCLDATNGECLWKNDDFKGGFVNDSPAVSRTGVFFSIRNYNGLGKVVRINKENGYTEWSYDLKARGANSPVIWGYAGALIVGDTNGLLYAIDGATSKDYGAFNDLPDQPAASNFQLGGKEYDNSSSRFNGVGTQITLATGTMNQGLMLIGANSSSEEGIFYCFKLNSSPVDLALENPTLDSTGTKASVDAKFLMGSDSLDTTVSWGVVSTDITMDEIKAMKPAALATLLPNSIDVKNFTLNETRNLTVDVPGDATRLVFVINPTQIAPQGELKWNNNFAEVSLLYNLVAMSIEPGVAGDADPESNYTATVIFTNDSLKAITGVPIGGIIDDEVVSLIDSSGNEVSTADFNPGESKEFTFTYTTPDSGDCYLGGVINTDPVDQKYDEDTFEDNLVETTVTVREVELPTANQGLLLEAVSQDGSIARKDYTAKWTDIVSAKLTIKKPKPPKGKLVWWRIDSAKLVYPKKNSEFTFGNPVPPKGTVTANMQYSGDQDNSSKKYATVDFEEDWGMDGAEIYNMIEDELMAADPKNYDITAKYQITYRYKYRVCSNKKCHWEYDEKTTSGSESADLLVYGTGVDSRAE